VRDSQTTHASVVVELSRYYDRKYQLESRFYRRSANDFDVLTTLVANCDSGNAMH